MTDNYILSIKDLSIAFSSGQETNTVVSNVNIDISPGDTYALVGESGSGKSITALSVLQLLSHTTATYPSGEILYQDKNLLSLDEKAIRQVRGNEISMIFQEPMTALNPLHNVERQISEGLMLHQNLTKEQAKTKTVELLELVQIKDAESRLKNYPHELSGGQRQRVMIAMALANKPQMLIADEPTTALDVTVQYEILELLESLKKSLNMSILLITHDLGIVKNYSNQVSVMQDGKVVESGPTQQIFTTPTNPYTIELLESEPKGGPIELDSNSSTILSTKNLSVAFPLEKPLFRAPQKFLNAVVDANIEVLQGSTLGIIGESGSGKSTLAFSILRLTTSTGDIYLEGNNIAPLKEKHVRPLRKSMQIVFQDPFGSMSPRLTIGQIVSEGLEVHTTLTKDAIEKEIKQILTEVDIDPESIHRYPHEFSGGQRQRISIARALVLKPKILVLDEPTSALDRAVQVQVLDLLKRLQQKFGLTYIFISHDINVVKSISHYIVVMRAGKIVEYGAADKVLIQPSNDYTKTLLHANLQN